MSGTMSFEAAEALVFDPVASNRTATRVALHALDFRKVDAVGTLELLEKHMAGHSADLLLCEVTGVESELCKFIQSLRQGHVRTAILMCW